MILLEKPETIEAIFGKSAPHRMVLGFNRIEQARQYPLGASTLVVGYINGIARYLAVLKKDGPKTPFTVVELEGVLNLVAPSSLWKETTAPKEPVAVRPANPRRRTTKPSQPTRYFKYVDKDAKSNAVNFEVLAWLPGEDAYAFCYIPSGTPPLFVTEHQVHNALG
jgi:hypothetical protein